MSVWSAEYQPLLLIIISLTVEFVTTFKVIHAQRTVSITKYTTHATQNTEFTNLQFKLEYAVFTIHNSQYT